MIIEPTIHGHRAWMDDRQFHLVTTDEEFEEMMHACLQADRLGLDTEGTGLHATEDQVCGWCLSPDPKVGYYVPVLHDVGTVYDSEKARKGIQEIVDSDITLDFWHAQFDINMMWNAGVKFWSWKNIFDGMLGYWLIDSSRNRTGLKHVTKELLGLDQMELWECFGLKKRPPKFVPVVRGLDPIDITVYAASDAMFTTENCQLIEKDEFFQLQKGVFSLEMATALVLAWMDRDTIQLDVEYVQEWKDRIEHTLVELESEIHDTVGSVFNIASQKVLGEILFKKLGLPILASSEKTGIASTDDSVLEQLKFRHPVVPLLQEWRHAAKLLSTYVSPFVTDQKDGKTRIGFYQAATDTGRIQGRKGKFELDGRIGTSISTIPKAKKLGVYDPRKAIVARNGFKFAAVDYQNEEMRLAANMSGEKVWLAALMDGRNLHREMACKMNGKKPDEVTPEEYAAAKGMNFRYLFGGGGPWEDDYNNYYAAVPNLKKWQDAQKEMMFAKGYVQTAYGRVRRGEDLVNSGDDKKRALAKRIAVNSPVQGSGSDILRLAIIQIVLGLIHKKHPELLGNIFLKLLIHDEIVFEIADEAMSEAAKAKGWTFDKILYAVCEVMESIGLPNWSCPLLVDGHVGPTWSPMTGTEFSLDRDNKAIIYHEKKSSAPIPGVSSLRTLNSSGDNSVFLLMDRSMLEPENAKKLKDSLISTSETVDGAAVRIQFKGSGKVHKIPSLYSWEKLEILLGEFAKLN